MTAFVLGGHTYVAATLRYAGAVIIYDVSNPAKPVFERIDRAGKGDLVGDGTCKGESEKSVVYPPLMMRGLSTMISLAPMAPV